MLKPLVSVGVLVAALAAAAADLSAQAQPQASRLIDRTYSCSAALVGGIRQAKIRARRASGPKAGTWNRPALAGLSTSAVASADRAIYNEIAWVSAGRPAKQSTVVDVYYPGIEFPIRTWGTIGVNTTRCRPSSARVGLARGGLASRAVGPFDDAYDCASRTVLVRVRAELSSASALTSFRGFVRTTAPVERAIFVVRTPTGKALAYSEVTSSGRTRLYVAPGCYPD